MDHPSPLVFSNRDIVESVREPLLVLSADLEVRHANRSFFSTFHVTAEQTLRRLVYELGNQQWDIPALRKLLEEVLSQNISFNDFEVTHNFESIGQKVMLVNARRIYQEHVEIPFILLAFEDITERRRAERAVNDALAYASNIIETVREPMLVLDGQLRVRTANRSFYQAFRVTPEETEGGLLYDLGDGQWNIPPMRKLLEEILPQHTSFDDFEVTHEFDSIGRRVMLLNARRMFRAANESELILLAVEDITERRRLEDERRELETRFIFLVKNIRDHSIFTLDTQGRITSWNREAERIIGFTEGEVLGRHYSIIFTPEDIQAGVPAQELTTALAEGRAEDERWHLRKNGERFWALGIVSLMHDVTGGHTGFAKILRDMTDRKMAEEAMQRADRCKDEFLATLAHELRNPMAPLLNGLQILKFTTDREKAEEVRSMMERQLEQMVRLVDDLMDISRISRNKLEMRKNRIDLRAVVQSAVETARPQIEANGHALTVTMPLQPLCMDGDLNRLAQVFWNLLNNSAKYTEPCGQISLSVESINGEAVVTVRDNGIGIPAESLSNLFEMFSQVDRNLERAQGGLGIGLALVKGLTEAHGGSVKVQSGGTGQGCMFVVRLPLAQGGSTSESLNEPQTAKPGSRQRILIVDDNRDGAASLAILLTVMGNETRTAHDGADGLVSAEAFRPDLIVLDIGLPKLNGYEACRRIREQPWGKDITIVASTGWGQEEDRRRSKEAGFDCHLVKPVDAADIIGLLAKTKS